MLEFLLLAAATAGLAYYGKKQNDEAKTRNDESKSMVDEANKYVDQVNKGIEDESKFIQGFLEWYGGVKTQFSRYELKSYLTFMKKFKNFEVIQKEADCQYHLTRLAGMDEIKKNVETIDSICPKIENNSTKDAAKTLAISLGTFGIGTTISTIAAGGISTLTSTVTGLALSGFLPLSFGFGYGVVGFLNNYKSKQNAEKALEYIKKVNEMKPNVSETFAYLGRVNNFLVKLMDDTSARLNSYKKDIEELYKKSKDKNSPFYSYGLRKLDASKLSLEDQEYLKYFYIKTKITYALLDEQLFDEKGEFIEESVNKININRKKLRVANKEINGK